MMRMPAHIMDDAALIHVLDALQADGNRAYLVGGVVRNALLGEAVDDIDIATDAIPDTTIRLAKAAGLRAVPTGIDHGTVTLVHQGRGFEVTTFRRDVETDGRHAVVSFTDDMAQDAARRDFTMNALYADASGAVLDPMGGLPDLAARRLRFVGDAGQRIREDYLRILRFFRFFARYGHQADPEAIAACAAHKGGLSGIARERIGAEMRKLLAAPDPAASVALMQDTGVLDLGLPGAHPAALTALLRCEGDTPPAWQRRLAALHDDPATALRLSRSEAKVQASLRKAMSLDWSLDQAAYRLGPEIGADHALLQAARGIALPPDWRDQVAQAACATFPLSAADLPDLQGPALGRGLKTAEAAWIASGFALPAPALIDMAYLAGKEPL
ncbi:MAG: CCA tRNA nucleotidyltransferase [Paracoccus sp. (in: a-proteobacteria)]|nr:CCA tRNA nucleotidyltransferase [Paracoccus sp. (in: a-proteobacteria)]